MLIQTVIVVLDKEARDVAVAALTANNKGFVEFSTFVPYVDIEETLCGPEYNSVYLSAFGREADIRSPQAEYPSDANDPQQT
jgi:hypothetical protein